MRRLRCVRELNRRCRRCATSAAADASPAPPPPPLAAEPPAQSAKRPPRTAVDAEIVGHARKLRVDAHLFSVSTLSAGLRQCCAYGRLFPKPLLVRFVAATDAAGVSWMVPDASGHLPGRGAYTLASPRAVDLAVVNSAFTRQMKRSVVGMPDLPQRTHAALAAHVAQFAANVAALQLPLPPGALSRRRRRRCTPAPDAAAGAGLHEWRLCLWSDDGGDDYTGGAAAFPAEAQEPPLLGGERSAVRVLFALRRRELEAALGCGEGVAAWRDGALVRLTPAASAALSAAQWRLEGFRPACRPPGLRASGEAPPGWAPPKDGADVDTASRES